MDDKVMQQAVAYMKKYQVMTLATVGEAGVWAAAVFYVNDGTDLFFLSAGHTRHAQNIAASPRVAATIQADYDEWTAVQGIQLEGIAMQLHGESRRNAITLYQSKYIFLHKVPLSIQTALTQTNWYRLRPDKLYFVDNSKGFGHRDEVSLPVTSH